MESIISFDYRGQPYTANFFFSLEREPFYIFIYFREQHLISIFGTDVYIVTDGKRVLPSKNHYPELTLLLNSLFDVVKLTSEFKAGISERKIKSHH